MDSSTQFDKQRATASTVAPDTNCRCGHPASEHCGGGVHQRGSTPTACLQCSCGQFLRGAPTLLQRCLAAIETAIVSEDGLDGLVGERLLREAGYWSAGSGVAHQEKIK